GPRAGDCSREGSWDRAYRRDWQRRWAGVARSHLEGKQFQADREQVIARAREAGIEHIVAIGNGDGPGSLDCGIKLAEQYDFLHTTVGIHPHEAKLPTDADFQELERLARHPKVIAWGEIGLDYFYDHSPRDVQKRVFL